MTTECRAADRANEAAGSNPLAVDAYHPRSRESSEPFRLLTINAKPNIVSRNHRSGGIWLPRGELHNDGHAGGCDNIRLVIGGTRAVQTTVFHGTD